MECNLSYPRILILHLDLDHLRSRSLSFWPAHRGFCRRLTMDAFTCLQSSGRVHTSIALTALAFFSFIVILSYGSETQSIVHHTRRDVLLLARQEPPSSSSFVTEVVSTTSGISTSTSATDSSTTLTSTSSGATIENTSSVTSTNSTSSSTSFVTTSTSSSSSSYVKLSSA